IGAGQRADRRLAPEVLRCSLAIADIEPEKEAAGRPVEAEAAAERLFRDVEFAAVERAVGLDMRFVVPECRRRVLNGQRDLRAAIGAQMLEALNERGIAGDKAAAQARRVRALRERMKDQEIAEVAAE